MLDHGLNFLLRQCHNRYLQDRVPSLIFRVPFWLGGKVLGFRAKGFGLRVWDLKDPGGRGNLVSLFVTYNPYKPYVVKLLTEPPLPPK